MQNPLSQEDCNLKETSPNLSNGSNERLSTKYDLVEQMLFLYVRVVKAKGLPSKGNNGCCSHYVEAKVGNLRGITRHPGSEWNQVFKFSKDCNLPSVLEIMVRCSDFSKDDPVGLVVFDLNEILERVPPDSPLALQWYNLEDRRGNKVQGEVMLAVWNGTQADEAFPEAWHTDAGSISGEGMANLRSKVYVSPKLWYVRVNVIEAHELQFSDKTRFPEVFVKVVLGRQVLRMMTSQNQSVNHMWNEDLILVAAEPFEEKVIVSVESRVGPNKDEVMGKVAISLHNVERRLDSRTLNSKWYNLEKNNGGRDDGHVTIVVTMYMIQICHVT